MPVNPREPTEEEKDFITKNATTGTVELAGNTYRVDYGVSQESRVTQDSSFKKRTEKLTVSHEEDVIYFEVVTEATGTGEEKAVLPDPIVADQSSRKPCTFFNKGTCKNGKDCIFSHCYVPPRRR